MKEILGVEALKEKLISFEEKVEYSISNELKRIGRTVQIEELNYMPFGEGVADYIETIRLDEEGNTVLDTSLPFENEKYFSSFISDCQIECWDMIELLRMLKKIEA